MERYPSSAASRIITNDLYLAAYLLCEGCELACVERNERRRVSFVFSGERVRSLREAYAAGPVRLNVRSFRDNLTQVRRLMDGDPEQRSGVCPSSRRSPSVLLPA